MSTGCVHGVFLEGSAKNDGIGIFRAAVDFFVGVGSDMFRRRCVEGFVVRKRMGEWRGVYAWMQSRLRLSAVDAYNSRP